MEAGGIQFFNASGASQDCLQVLKGVGINAIRLRVWVNPAGGWCSQDDVVAKAVRARNLGLRVLIDFHYSDTWADPGHQAKPAAWANDGITQLKVDVANHTSSVLTALKAAGVTPEWVQVGNETNNGMLWPDGMASTSMANFAALITSGYNAVKSVFPNALVIVHVSNGYDDSLFRFIFGGLDQYGGKYDLIGMSLYPTTSNWADLDAQCLTTMNDMVATYKKPVMAVEVGMEATAPSTCKMFISDLIAKVESVPGGNGRGVFYWEPEAYNSWQGYKLGAFGINGAPTVAMNAFVESEIAPAFVSQPSSHTVATGSTVVFNAPVPDSSSATYQWSFNGAPVAGATSSTFLVRGATADSAGTYACTASNALSSKVSDPATLAVVTTADPGRLVNLSTRATVGTGADILIAGFVIGGAGTSGSEPLLTRGSGPALIPFGVTGTLPDPQLQLFSGLTSLGTNNGWAGDAAIAGAASSAGAFAWASPTSHDAALVRPMATGPYTVQISGQTGDTGVALAEVYDVTPSGTYTPSAPRLINLSARVSVGKGAGILIAGFIIGGGTSKTVLVRASGPALVPFGVTGTLPDPQLQLYSGSNLLGTNSAWSGDPQISDAAGSVGAFPWESATSKDSAILVTLPPGAYTAQVSGASSDTGVALVEVYDVP